MRRIWLTACAPMALIFGTATLAQERQNAELQNTGGAPDIIVTATLRAESLQEVPLAVSAFDTEALEKSGVRDLRDLSLVAPSFSLGTTNTESGGTSIRIRGVGTSGNNSGLEGAVGVFIDGVYLSRPSAALGDLLDVEQLELLRGPQGTLFGRNTTAGAINIRTAKPDLTRIEGFGNATYGNFNLFNLQGGVSGPLIQDTLGVRLSGAYRKRDGYVTSTTGAESNNRDRYLIRGQLLWEPSNVVGIRLIGDYSRSDEQCCDAVIIQDTSLVAAGLYAAVGLPADGGVPISGDAAIEDLISASEGTRDRFEQWGISGQLDWDLGGTDLVYIASYRSTLARPIGNADANALKIFSTSNQGATATSDSAEIRSTIDTLSQELRLSGALWEGALEFLVGGFYLDERIDELQSVTLGADFQRNNSVALRAGGLNPPPAQGNPALFFARGVNANGDFANNQFAQDARNWSLFTNNTLTLTEGFKLNVGARYSNDRKEATFDQLSARSAACDATRSNPALAGLPATGRSGVIALACFPLAARINNTGVGTPREFDGVFEDDALVYTAKLLWGPADLINTYASYTRGYKSGGFNLDPTAAINGADPTFDSETVDSYELGLRTQLIDRTLTANLTLFHQDFQNFQLLEFTGVQFFNFNVPKLKSSGFELELTAFPSSNLTINASLTYTNARFPDDCAGDLPLTAAFSSVRLLCGSRLSGAPEYVAIAGFDYGRDIGNTLNFSVNGSLRLESDRRTASQELTVFGPGTGQPDPRAISGGTFVTPGAVQDGKVLLSLRAGIGSQDGLWRLEVWGQNLTDSRILSASYAVPLRGTAAVGPNGLARAGTYAEPRTYGVTIRTRF